MKRKKEKMSKKQFAETMAQELNRYFEENLTMEVHAAIREFVKTNDYTHYAIVLERPGVYALPALNVETASNPCLEHLPGMRWGRL